MLQIINLEKKQYFKLKISKWKPFPCSRFNFCRQTIWNETWGWKPVERCLQKNPPKEIFNNLVFGWWVPCFGIRRNKYCKENFSPLLDRKTRIFLSFSGNNAIHFSKICNLLDSTYYTLTNSVDILTLKTSVHFICRKFFMLIWRRWRKRRWSDSWWLGRTFQRFAFTQNMPYLEARYKFSWTQANKRFEEFATW